MRYARFAIFLSALMIATGVFLPYIQLGVGGFAFGKGSSMTLYDSVNNYQFLEAASSKVDVSMAQRIANGLLPKAGTKGESLARKFRDATSTVEDIQEVQDQEYVQRFGKLLRAAGIAFLSILLIVAWLLLKSLSTGLAYRGRAIAIAALMTLVSVGSVGLYIAAGEAIALGNAELGGPLLGLGSGAYLMLLGGLAGFVSPLVALWFEIKATAPARAVSNS